MVMALRTFFRIYHSLHVRTNHNETTMLVVTGVELAELRYGEEATFNEIILHCEVQDVGHIKNNLIR